MDKYPDFIPRTYSEFGYKEEVLLSFLAAERIERTNLSRWRHKMVDGGTIMTLPHSCPQFNDYDDEINVFKT